ncbi:hypothetical protein N431DRAFT_442064 [Stipitochalara longipes BDJ]|nr:hypothetical protein N431DRAFT_442064 [Stipitochalara longipes BDJ]
MSPVVGKASKTMVVVDKTLSRIVLVIVVFVAIKIFSTLAKDVIKLMAAVPVDEDEVRTAAVEIMKVGAAGKALMRSVVASMTSEEVVTFIFWFCKAIVETGVLSADTGSWIYIIYFTNAQSEASGG